MGLNSNALDFHTEVSKGLVPKHSLIHKFGHNLAIDTGSDPETVWSAGVYMSSQVQLTHLK